MTRSPLPGGVMMDMPAALALAREAGVPGDAAVAFLEAMRAGLAEGLAEESKR